MNKTKRTEAEQAALLAYLIEKYEYLPGGLVRHKGHEKPLKPRAKKKIPYYELGFRFQGRLVFVQYHIIIWVLCKARWPTMPLDHLNGNPRDNRIENLRECTPSENNLNTMLAWKPNPGTGVPSVSENYGRYQCRIRGENLYFKNPYEAFWYAILCGKRYR